jgi:hypothetical protein
MSAPDDDDRTASLMTPAKLAQLKVRPAPAASPGAWLDQMAADAGSGHVRRLQELRQQLEALARARAADVQPLAAACQALHDALAQLDVAQVQPRGWLARATGKGKEAAAGFAAQAGRVERAGEDLADDLRALQKQQAAQGAAQERLALEIEAEVRALDKIMDQGARWLQDMRSQLRTRQAQGGDAAAQRQDQEDAARCELLVERLKVLRTVTAATQQAMERCKVAGAARSALASSLQQVLEEDWASGRQKIAVVARQVEAGKAASEGVDQAASACEALRTAMKQAGEDCASVQAQEQAALDELSALQAPLQAAT